LYAADDADDTKAEDPRRPRQTQGRSRDAVPSFDIR